MGEVAIDWSERENGGEVDSGWLDKGAQSEVGNCDHPQSDAEIESEIIAVFGDEFCERAVYSAESDERKAVLSDEILLSYLGTLSFSPHQQLPFLRHNDQRFAQYASFEGHLHFL